ncbi:MAG TPA: glycosyltransferase family 4 protein, partial [Vicinamibacterales bacterium]|nr:glycosyltransferase family 4 protein [Vicinamibacterales bacterium]
GDTIGTFMEPIATGIAARGHEVHVVLPWHPRLARGPVENGVRFHPFRYAPHPGLNVFGYAAALQADVRLRGAAYLAAPLALAASYLAVRRVAAEVGATLLHGHWIIPSGAVVTAARRELPTVVSLHGSDVYVAERHAFARAAAQAALRRLDWLTACSDDLRDRMIALGADPTRAVTIPYGVDPRRFRPDEALRTEGRRAMGAAPGDLVLFTAGRFVRKKGFEYLIDAVARLAPRWPALRLVIGGGGDLEAELRARAAERGVSGRVGFPGVLAQDAVAACLAGADLAVVPSVRDDAGNVDGLPNTVMEALASGTALVATRIGGIPSVVEHGRTGWLVAERDAGALEAALDRLLADPHARAAIGSAARADVLRRRTWPMVAEAFEQVYDRAADRAESRRKTD